MKVTIDFETRSRCELKSSGPWVYAEDPSTEVLCMAMMQDDQPPLIWAPVWVRDIIGASGLPMVDGEIVQSILEAADTIEAHNVAFERSILEKKLAWKIDPKKYRCSAAKAAAHSLPRDLEGAGRAIGLAVQKDKEGSFLMRRMCKPTIGGKWIQDRASLIRLCQYCMQDVRAEYALSEALRDLSPAELQVWQTDQEINRRGIRVDVELARTAMQLVADYEGRALAEFRCLTGFDSPRQVPLLVKWLRGQGAKINDVTKATVIKLLAHPAVPPNVKRVLEIRQSLGKSSLAKLLAFVNAANADGRARDTMMYHGASTGRWSGKRIQPHNFPREGLPNCEDFLGMVRNRDIDSIEIFYGDLMPALSKSLRSFIKAEAGYELVCADFNAIEGRVLAWLAREDYVLENYRQKRDAYCVFAEQIQGGKYSYKEILEGHHAGDKKYSAMRFEGKTGELACGYQGGEAAVKRFAPDMPVERRIEIVGIWRRNRPKTVAFWREIETMVKTAIARPGALVNNGMIAWGFDEKFLRCRLPSGRLISYYGPWLSEEGQIKFWGVNSVTKQWEENETYGGKLTENVVQAISRDLLAAAIMRLEKAGKPVVMHVHDEVISEVPKGSTSIEEYIEIVTALPAWAKGLPLAAEGFITERYRK